MGNWGLGYGGVWDDLIGEDLWLGRGRSLISQLLFLAGDGIRAGGMDGGNMSRSYFSCCVCIYIFFTETEQSISTDYV